MSDIALNSAQRAAVEHRPAPLLVIAGAGSGKTRVLTARIAWLLEGGARPESVVAFTFTNRAAREMRERIHAAVGDAAGRLWVGTFHATAVRILRRDGAALGIPPSFVIYDREDQEGLVREAIGDLGMGDNVMRPAAALARISDAKNALVDPATMARTAFSPHDRRVAEVYAGYQQRLHRAGALDFDDLIAETVRLFLEHEDVHARYAERFRHVLVDEYQDTNHVQFRLVERLAARHLSLFAVGDDDQSIYGWRGADLSNVLDFERAFPDAQVLRLEQNYRSTARILRAANAVIANNESRKGKTLWCDREEGAPLRFVLTSDEVDEARRVRGFLAEAQRHGRALADCAVLYRTNAQSRALETELRQHLIPYEIVGGVSFYQRREVKDLIAYLRLIVNPADTVAFWRIWNTPRRGLGPAVRARVEQAVAAGARDPLEALRALLQSGGLSGAARAGAAGLIGMFDELRGRTDAPADAQFAAVLERTGYLEYLGADEGAAERRANVEELGAAAAGFAAAHGGTLGDFLAEAALVSDLDMVHEERDRVLLLTAHNAKGLEFPVVIVAGLEEGLLPHASSLDEPSALEEERRLFYVALTRARDEVFLTAAAYRRRWDGARGGVVSRFVDEIPAAELEREELPEPMWTGGGGHASRARRGGGETVVPVARRHPALGREVFHEQFGRGVVVAADGEGFDARFTVRFGTRVKRVLGRYLSGGHDGD